MQAMEKSANDVTTNLKQDPDSLLFTSEVEGFLRCINSYYMEEEQLCKAVKQLFPPVAEQLHISYFSIKLDAPGNMIAPDGQKSTDVLYENAENYEPAREHIIEFKTADKGIYITVVCPTIGHTWSAAEQSQVKLIAECIFTGCARVRMLRLLTQAITYDYMTGAYNTQGMATFAGKLRAQQLLKNYVGMFLNLKNFKLINESVGSKCGDLILINYCKTLIGHLAPDERISRPGGDNFFLLVRKEHVQDFCTLLRETPVTIEKDGKERTYTISAHVGIYDITAEDDMGVVMDRATSALNAVKHSGQAETQLWYNSALQEKLMYVKRISQLFPHALKNEEFIVYYQPKVLLETKTLCGCEALVRWRHEGRIIPPMDFIPVLEKEGTVCTLDFYVFEQVCRTIREWLDRGIEPVRVSVNFSQQHLHDEMLAEKIVSIMEKYHVDSRYIEAELTEMSGVKNHDAMLVFLRKMKEYGICTSIDDFGTGYSSLNMLREFHMDIIKLDKSFLDRIADQQADTAKDEIMLKNIIRLAQELELEIISEGVETEHQAEFLRSIHCNMAQGYLFDKPLPQEQFEERLTGDRVYHLLPKK